jgi:hypothetical protein
MFTRSILFGALALGLVGTAQATTVTDPVNDFLPTYTGPHQADLDVTSFSVTYNAGLQQFLVQSTMAGAIDPTLGGFYAIGVNTGGAASPGPFAGIGEPGVIFTKVISVQKNGTATISGASVPGGVLVGGNAFSLIVPLSMLPSTGLAPLLYGWNIWPRSGTTPGTAVISDFAPENTTISAVPEPASWAMMIGGFSLVGAAMRRRRIGVRFA